ncbi:MAG: hypothetical protein IPO65_13515 [Saprospiraceae bacterium]|nr:hypothetical protein [Saprospiraceae bacterium]
MRQHLRHTILFNFVLAALIVISSQNLTFGQVFVNEIHYDNTGADIGERIEVAGLAGTNLAGYSIYMYNGGDGTTYANFPLVGTLTNQCTVSGNNVGTAVFDVLALTGFSFQNGPPDGFALVDPMMNVVEFLSYEGSFTAIDGPANGSNSVDIGTSEPSTALVNSSIQRTAAATWVFNDGLNTFNACNTTQYFPTSSIAVNLSVSSPTGSEATPGSTITVTATASAAVTGNQTVTLAVSGAFITGGDYTLSNTTITIPNGGTVGTVNFNVVNDAVYEGLEVLTLTMGSPSGGIVLGPNTIRTISITDNETEPAYEVWSNEIHYDNTGIDANEKIEIAGASGTNLAGWAIYYYDGSNGLPYGNPSPLSGTLPITCTVSGENVGVVVIDVPATNGGFAFQGGGGSPDGWALVDPNGGVVDFYSYEGVITALGGPANGKLSVDIGVQEDGTGTVDGSIQRTGETTWVVGASANTFGACNSTQFFPIPPCPMFSGAPANVSITNSSCDPMCVVNGGSITAPGGSPCPAMSTLQYQVNGGSWTSVLPTYNQTGPVQNIKTRCSCDNDPMVVSTESGTLSTAPGTCTFTTWYQDMDGDTYGNPAVSQSNCNQPMGYVGNANDCNDNVFALNIPPYVVTLNGVCYASIEAALAVAMSGNTIEVVGNISSIGVNVIPVGVTVQVNAGATWSNSMMLTNNGTITEIGSGNFINAVMGVYKGTGLFNGTLNNSGIVATGN